MKTLKMSWSSNSDCVLCISALQKHTILIVESAAPAMGGVRIVEWLSHSTVVQEVPGSNPGAAEKCWAVMELFVNIYLYEFVLSLLCVRVRCFGLY